MGGAARFHVINAAGRPNIVKPDRAVDQRPLTEGTSRRNLARPYPKATHRRAAVLDTSRSLDLLIAYLLILPLLRNDGRARAWKSAPLAVQHSSNGPWNIQIELCGETSREQGVWSKTGR